MADEGRRSGVEELTEALADGKPIDWKEVHGELAADDGRLAGLELLHEVGLAFRSAGETPDPVEILFEWGPLQVIEKLGEGSFGEVYRAIDAQLGRAVALKLRKARDEDGPDPRWLDEGRRLARIRHQNVLTVHGAAGHAGREGIWTDLVEGETLRERLDRDGTLGAAELVATGTALCQALAAIHAEGMIHGDVKAQNIMREAGGNLVLLDFGSGSEVESPAGGRIQGSPLTSAPENLRGEEPTARSDLYSLGATLYLLASGTTPIEAGGWEELVARASSGEITPLRDHRPDLPATVIEVIETALSARPDERYRSAGEMEAALRRSLDGAFTERGIATRVAEARERGARRPLRWLTLGVALAVLVAALATARFFTPAPPPGRGTAIHATFVRGGPPDVALADGAGVRLGDRLGLEVEVGEETYLYVLNEDDEGALFTLFPLPEVELANPLAAGRHRLPGTLDGEVQSWVVTSAGGSERFLVVASRVALPLVEDFVRRAETASADRVAALGGPADEVGGSAGERLRGVGGLAGRPATASSRLGVLRDSLLEQDDAVWTEILELEGAE